jgi:pyruvate/2-oxoglutarate dehydrogenase complex dihydrolipoamide dehydrogenase (E3) component
MTTPVEQHFDAVIIGAGQGGGPLAAALAGAGRRTALIERARVGGTCINYGCTPTKTMVASARVAHLARRAAAYGVRVEAVDVDLQVVRRRKRQIVETFHAGSLKKLESAEGLTLVRGEARFTGPRRLLISGASQQTITADLVILDTGASPLQPRIPGLAQTPHLDSTTVMELAEMPERLLVLGGGYVGLEFAQMFRRFGAEVAIIQGAGQLLSREDEDVAAAVAAILRDDGIEVLLNSETQRVERWEGGLALQVRTPAGMRSLEGSHLLVATGRQPNTSELGLEQAGIQTDERGFVRVDERLRTSADGVYALGDVKGGPAFTHVSYDDYRILRTNLIEGGAASTRNRLVPYVIYIDPELGRVGMTEREARAAGHEIRVARLPMSSAARALERDETRGFIKAVVDGRSGNLLGCAVLAVEGGEIMTVLQMAMLGGMTYERIRDAMFAHPTLAESLNNLFMSWDDDRRPASG